MLICIYFSSWSTNFNQVKVYCQTCFASFYSTTFLDNMDKLEQKQECGGCQEAHLFTEMKEWFHPIQQLLAYMICSYFICLSFGLLIFFSGYCYIFSLFLGLFFSEKTPIFLYNHNGSFGTDHRQHKVESHQRDALIWNIIMAVSAQSLVPVKRYIQWWRNSSDL